MTQESTLNFATARPAEATEVVSIYPPLRGISNAEYAITRM